MASARSQSARRPSRRRARYGGYLVTTHATWRLGAAALAALVVALCGCGGGGGGAPPADVAGRVLLVSTNQPPDPPATVRVGGRSATTAVDGTFVLTGVASTATEIVVTASGAPELRQPLPTLAANTRTDLGDLFLSSQGYTATAVGRIVRVDTFAPVANARVRLSGQVQVTGADGAFRFTGLPVGLGGTTEPVGLVTAQGFEDKPISLDLPLGPPGNPPSDNDLGDIPISPPVGGIPGGPSNIRGAITVQGATDFAGTTVTLIDRSTGSTVATRQTASDGAYGFWVVAGAYAVRAEHVGFQTKTQDVTLQRPDRPVTVNLTLVP